MMDTWGCELQARLLGEELRGHVRRSEAEAEELRVQLEGARAEATARQSHVQQVAIRVFAC